MKKFFDNIFKPYIFPIILLIIGAFLKTGENLKSFTIFFSNNSNSFLKFFSHQFYLWEVILYIIIVFVAIKLYQIVFNNKSKKEKAMENAIKKVPKDFPIHITNTNNKFIFKFEAKTNGNEYKINSLRPYCVNCSDSVLRMTEINYGEYRCNCGKEIGYNIYQDVESRIITVLEETENNN